MLDPRLVENRHRKLSRIGGDGVAVALLLAAAVACFAFARLPDTTGLRVDELLAEPEAWSGERVSILGVVESRAGSDSDDYGQFAWRIEVACVERGIPCADLGAVRVEGTTRLPDCALPGLQVGVHGVLEERGEQFVLLADEVVTRCCKGYWMERTRSTDPAAGR